jgi:hypothetical protein
LEEGVEFFFGDFFRREGFGGSFILGGLKRWWWDVVFLIWR